MTDKEISILVSQKTRQTRDTPAAQSATQSAKSVNKSVLSAKEEHTADMMPVGFERAKTGLDLTILESRKKH